MAIVLKKVIPSGMDWYSGGGSTAEEITIHGAHRITLNTRKSLLKIKKPTYQDLGTDKARIAIVDLVRVDDTFKINGYLLDTPTDSAWNQYWKLRAMCVRTGPLVELKVDDNHVFNSSTQMVFLEEMQGEVVPDDSGDLATNKEDYRNRVEVELQFYLGDPRRSS